VAWHSIIKKVKGQYYHYLHCTWRIPGGGRATPPRSLSVYVAPANPAVARTAEQHKDYINAVLNGKDPFTAQSFGEYCQKMSVEAAIVGPAITEIIDQLRQTKLKTPDPRKQTPTKPQKHPTKGKAAERSPKQAVADRLAVEPRLAPPAPSSSLRRAEPMLKALNLNPGTLPQDHQYYQALFHRLKLDPTKAQSVRHVYGSKAEVTTIPFGQHQVRLPRFASATNTTATKPPTKKPSGRTRPPAKEDQSLAYKFGEGFRGLIFGADSKAKTVPQLLNKHVLGFIPKSAPTAKRRTTARPSKPVKTTTAKAQPVSQEQLEHLTRQAYSRTFLAALQTQAPRRYKDLKDNYPRLHKDTKKSLANFQANTNTANPWALSLHARMTGQLSQWMRNKLKPESLGLFDHDPKGSWLQDAAALHARIVQHGPKTLEGSLLRELKTARRSAATFQTQITAAKATLTQTSRLSLSTTTQLARNQARRDIDNKTKALKRANAKIDGINATICKIALLEAYSLA